MRTLKEEMKREREDTEKGSCSMGTARTTLWSIGFIKRMVKEDTGSTESPIKQRSIKKKVAQGKKERSVQKKRAVQSSKRKSKKDTRRNDIEKAFVLVMRGTEVAWTEKRTR